ncbi:MAG: putative amidoligase domain-containing protein [Methylocystaceae bacterium]
MAHVIINYPHVATANMMAQALAENFPLLKTENVFSGDLSYVKISFVLGSNSQEDLVYNHEIGLRNAKDPGAILKLNRVSYSRYGSWLRRYRVHMVNQQVIAIARQNLTDPVTGKPLPVGRRDDHPYYPVEADDREVAKVIALVIRTLYSLGLDIGMVKVSVDSLYRLHVIDVDPAPGLTKKTMQRYVKAIFKDATNQLTIDPKSIVMGTDPEFMLANSKSGNLVPASYFFPRAGEVGCDNIRMPNRKHRPVAEFRPYPSSNPYGLVENLKKSMHKANRLAPYRNLKWVAGVMPLGYPIGGHIHFSGIPLNNHLLRALDTYLALPLSMLEPSRASRDRRRRYGLLGEFRTKTHGGFEYRTPSSWLIDPEITLGALSLGYIIATGYNRLPTDLLMYQQAQDRFYAGDQEYFQPFIDQLWKQIQTLPGFREYNLSLEPLFDTIRKGEPWDENIDIRKTWGLPIPQLIYKDESTKLVPNTISRQR